jgi:hypothetical protein
VCSWDEMFEIGKSTNTAGLRRERVFGVVCLGALNCEKTRKYFRGCGGGYGLGALAA